MRRSTPRFAAPLLLAAALALGACETVSLQAPDPAMIAADADTVVNDREIIALVNTRSAADALAAQARRRGYTLTARDELSGLALVMLTFDRPAGLGGSAAIAELERLQPGSTAGVNHAYGVENGVAVNLDAIKGTRFADELLGWPSAACKAAAPMGMIDTGLRGEWPGHVHVLDVAGGRAAPHEHGDIVASLLSDPHRLDAVSLYVAEAVAMGEDGRTAAGVDAMLRALDWFAGEGVPVVNVSLAGPYNKLLDRGVARALDQGMVIVAAVGNAGPDAPPRYPAAFEGVVGVTAVDAQAAIYRRAVRGASVDVSAPGVDVWVEADGAERFVSGTSIAAAFVTARIAADPTLIAKASSRSVEAALRGSARDLGPDGPDAIFGAGLVSPPTACRPAT